MEKRIKVTLKCSSGGSSKQQQDNLRGLGLRRINQSRILQNTSSIRGMMDKVKHLIEINVIN